MTMTGDVISSTNNESSLTKNNYHVSAEEHPLSLPEHVQNTKVVSCSSQDGKYGLFSAMVKVTHKIHA